MAEKCVYPMMTVENKLFMMGPVEMVFKGDIDISPDEVSENDVKIYKI